MAFTRWLAGQGGRARALLEAGGTGGQASFAARKDVGRDAVPLDENEGLSTGTASDEPDARIRPGYGVPPTSEYRRPKNTVS